MVKKMTVSQRKMQMREEARKKIKGPSGGVTGSREYRERVEQGRQQFLVKSSEGGDPRAKRLKGEIEYLLNNYSPAYDTRLEGLIDQWRRSGDPTYSPEIKIRLREARKLYMRDSKPI